MKTGCYMSSTVDAIDATVSTFLRVTDETKCVYQLLFDFLLLAS
jgi:hypothetical protein